MLIKLDRNFKALHHLADSQKSHTALVLAKFKAQFMFEVEAASLIPTFNTQNL